MRVVAEPVPLAPDPAVPQRDELLDAEAVGDRLARLLGRGGAIDVGDCRRVYARYRPGRRLRVLYRLQIDGEPQHVAASTFAGHERTRQAFAEASHHAVPSGALPPVVRDAALNTVFWTFPNDRKIGALCSLMAGSPALGRLLGRPVTPQLVSYVPERAATAACLDPAGATIGFAKVYGGDGGRRAHAAQCALAAPLGRDDARLRLPAILRTAQREDTIIWEAIPGRALSELGGPALDVAMRRLGAALACLHRLKPAAPLPVNRRRRADLIATVDAIARARPDAAEEARALLGELMIAWPARSGPPACVHGDAALHNARLEEGRVVLLDIEEATLGPAAADLGRVLAWLRAHERLGRLDRAGADTLAAELIVGYGEAGRLPQPAELRWHVAASLLTTRAPRSITWLDPEYAGELVPLLREARDLVA